MHSLIEKLFKKRGIKNTLELDAEEKETFDSFERKLSKRSLSVEDIKEFCQGEKKKIEAQFLDPKYCNKQNIQMKGYLLAVYSALLNAIDGPEVEREAAERELRDLINK